MDPTDVNEPNSSSLAENLGVTSDPSPPDGETGVDTSDSPTETTEPEGPSSLAEVIQQAANPEPETPPEENPEPTDPNPEDPKPEDTPQDEVVLPPEITEEELKSYTPNANKRIRQVVSERNQLREIVEDIKPQMDFVQRNQIPSELVDFGLNVAAALKYGDHETLLRALSPHIIKAQQALGLSLPEDLQKQVDQGFTTRELASELARQRATAELNQTRLQETRTQQIDRENEMTRVAIKSAVDSWQNEVRKTDPDFDKKSELITQYAHGLLSEFGAPTSPDQALAMAQEAKRRADEFLKSVTPPPAPQATRPRPSSVNSPGITAKPQPTSLQEAVMAGLKRTA